MTRALRGPRRIRQCLVQTVRFAREAVFLIGSRETISLRFCERNTPRNLLLVRCDVRGIPRHQVESRRQLIREYIYLYRAVCQDRGLLPKQVEIDLKGLAGVRAPQEKPLRALPDAAAVTRA
jgi:hypothetical protein